MSSASEPGPKPTQARLPLALFALLLATGVLSACGASASQEGESVPVPSKGTCSGCYRGHGVSFTYPPRWQKTEDVKAPISDLWYVVLSLHEPAGYVKAVRQG